MGGRVEGRVALITGGASGLGAEDARVRSREGAKVVITDINDEAGQKLAEELGDALYLKHDVRDEARWNEVVKATIDHFGRLDTLVNNAGLVKFGTVEEQTAEDFRFLVDVMLTGTYLGCRAAIPHMSKDGSGSIINISSISGLVGMSAIPAYSAAKAGVIGLTRSVAVHCKEQKYRIRVNAAAPGSIVTPMTAQALAELPEGCAGLEHQAAYGMGQPSDIANMILYLASDEGRHINGTTITIDNGETME